MGGPNVKSGEVLSVPVADVQPTVGGVTELLHLPPATVARGLAALDWDFVEAPADVGPHGLHPYPAKFTPQLPRQVIAALSRVGEVVLDPFAGGGTTAVEALALARSSYCIDANSVGVLLARAKTTPLTEEDLRALQQLEADLLALGAEALEGNNPPWLPSIPNLLKWYDSAVFQALGVIRARVMIVATDTARSLALIAFANAASRLSYQDSETRYSSRPRQMNVLEAPRTVLAELRRMRQVAQRVPEAGDGVSAEVVEGDSRLAEAYEGLAEGSVGLVVTSPPYPNAYDYHLYQRFRLFWLGADPKTLRSVEIGSHLTNQGLAAPERKYIDDMSSVLEQCHRVLMPGRWMAVVVGDGLFRGEVFRTSLELADAATTVGFEHVLTVDRALPEQRRSVTKPGRRLTHEQIVFLRRPASERTAVVIHPNYTLFPYEEDLQLRELTALGGSPRRHDGTLCVVPADDLARASFVHGIALADETRLTGQRLLEASAASGRRKHSTYATHGIHQYKGKFYPQLAKALLNLSGAAPGESLVADPFGGSGTLAAEATLAGIDAVSIDWNPLAIAVAKAKVGLLVASPEETRRAIVRVHTAVMAAPASGSATLNQFREEVQEELARWFPAAVLSKLDWLLSHVREEGPETASWLEVLISDLVREVSHQDPKDLRIRRRRVPLDDAPVYALFLRRLSSLSERLEDYWRHYRQHATLRAATIAQGSSTEPGTWSCAGGRPIDAVISSPPYASALPYIDTDRLSLAAVYGLSAADRRHLEEGMIGSREITERAREAHEAQFSAGLSVDLPGSTVAFLSAFREAVQADPSAGFRRRQAPAVLHRYFVAMSRVLGNVRDHMRRGAGCWLVLGDSRSTLSGRTWTIPTVDEVAALGEYRGFEVVDRIPITVTREDRLHSRHAITQNVILELRAA